MSICTFHLYPQNISKRMVNECLKRYFNATVYMEFEHVLLLQSMKTIRCRYVRQPMCLLMHFLLFQNPFSSVRTVYID